MYRCDAKNRKAVTSNVRRATQVFAGAQFRRKRAAITLTGGAYSSSSFDYGFVPHYDFAFR
ncbi:hypothetical protein BLA6992_00174 [Burkholderia lata]|uniref:Uncharacterized protein n=1 Tax=Burkholderia lata (strain ATCC 17760 / DSM 23089 / LMG 22485 / NCIMB 9086 / R18194 / 383) TaxID=482957 RepID=A0A6P2INX1_BURL3|nr:hypothetical protein BLA6863_01349 [Burkholderia lata]VWL87292.1 hypothetical protein BLA6992_00174 [Burkholderia lata]